MRLKELYKIYKNWLYIENTNRIDIGLAIRLISRTYGTRVWLLIVGPSGDWKSEQIMALFDPRECKIIRCLTAKTLVTGSTKMPDLAPKLKDKTILIPDMAQILQLHPNEKASVWGQLRDLYDGFAGKQSGMGKDVDYKDLNVTLIACSTPAIDKQILIHQDLGTRELIWRTEEDEKKCIDLMEKVLENEENESIMREELRSGTLDFLSNKKYIPIKISEDVLMNLKTMARKLSYLRAPADFDHFTGDLIGKVYPEQPTRVLKQFKRIFIALKSLDPDYPDEKALEIIDYLVKSSASKIRSEILDLFIEDYNSCEVTTNKIASVLKIGQKTSYKELNVLWNLGIVNRRSMLNDISNREKHFWTLNQNHFLIQQLMNIIDFQSEIKEDELADTFVKDGL